MITAPKTRYLIVSAFLFQIVFSCSALAHLEKVKFFPSDANAGDGFGVSVAIDGNTAVVGAYQNDSNGGDCGAAYVYEFSGSQWVQKQKLIPSDGAAGDKFGKSVAIQDNTIVVGSYDDNEGSAYVFSNSGGVWTQQQKIVAPDAATGDKFGCSVAIDNNTIVIGAYGDNGYAGSASVFVLAGSSWVFQQKLTALNAESMDIFGCSVAIDNNIIIIGAPNDDYSGISDAGSAYIYQRQDATWLEQNILRASDSGPFHHFGYSVAIDGNWAVIGAYECNIGSINTAGAAYVFSQTDANWVERQKLFDANDPCSGDDFGSAVAIKDDTILVGCPYDFVNGNMAGSVFEFVRTGTNWVQSDRLAAGDANTNDRFGSSLALSGRHTIIGVPNNLNNNKSTGAAYIFNENDAVAGDFDGDSDVDFIDFTILADAWRQNNPLVDIAPTPASDGIVDMKDFDVLCDNWLVGK
ncbi:MAG: FG-GAP repeat protein [Sedimentisphaerales bacterium]